MICVLHVLYQIPEKCKLNFFAKVHETTLSYMFWTGFTVGRHVEETGLSNPQLVYNCKSPVFSVYMFSNIQHGHKELLNCIMTAEMSISVVDNVDCLEDDSV